MQKSLLHSRDRHDWNEFVAACGTGHVLQSWEWGEVKSRSGWEPIRLALHQGGRIRAAAQVLVRTLPYGVGRLAYVPRGPALEYGDGELLGEMVAALRAFAGEWHTVALKIEPDVLMPTPLVGALASLGLRPASPVQMRSSIWVDLTVSEDDMLARQKQKTRYNIRLAARRGVIVRQARCEEINRWYGMYGGTAARDGFTVHGLQYYRDVMEVLRPSDIASLLLAEHEGDLLAGILVFHFGHTAQYMYGASSDIKRNLMAPYLLQWEGMRLARSRGARTYDLWGIPDVLEEREDLWGVYRHKRGYGGEIVRYAGAFDFVRAPLRHLALERVARPLFKRLGPAAG